VPVQLIHPTKGSLLQRCEAVVDAGADDCILPITIATQLGLALLQTGAFHRIRWRGSAWAIQFSDVLLRLDDGVHTCTWPARVAFSPAPIPNPLLGQMGCLQFFNATYLGADQLVVLEPSSIYPGTTT
jgi:hypothetical protein